MKNLLLIVALVASFAVARAEQYDELDLLGGWELISCEGDYPLFTQPAILDVSLSDCKYMYLGVLFCPGLFEEAPHDDHILPGITNTMIGHDFGESSNGLIYKSENKWVENENNNSGKYEGEYDYGSDGVGISNFFICGENKLNIVIQVPDRTCVSLKFFITTLNDKELSVKSYDGKCTVSYKRISGEITGMNGIAADNNDAVETYYDLNGIRRNIPEKGINIIRKGRTAKKVAVK